MTEPFFFDSYALIEIAKGSEPYKRYSNYNIVTTRLNLFELFYILLRDIDEKTACFAISRFSDFTVDFDNQTVEDAARFKLLHKKKNLSMTDCIGYFTARKSGLRFLTGDQQFEHMLEVEFVH